MEVIVLPVNKVKEWENNARIHTKRNLEALKKCLTEFGQTKPILVQESNMRIIAGNGTYEAICALGWDTVECRLLDLSDEKAEALAVADNRIGDLSQWDERILVESLKKLQDEGTLEIVGYDSLELEKMISYKGGNLFEDLNEESPKEKPTQEDFKKFEVEPEANSIQEEKPETEDDVLSYDDQMNFTLNGFVFSLIDRKEIEEIKYLIEYLKDAEEKDKKEVNEAVFESIKSILTEKFMR